MPGLLPNTLSGFSATPSASRASTRGPFPKPFTDQRNSHADDAYPSVAKSVRLSHFPALQAMGVQSRPLAPVTEAAKAPGLCTDRRTMSIGRNMVPEYNSSGSEHDPSSVCLVAMVNEFMESESACPLERADSRNSAASTTFTGFADISNSLQSLACCQDDIEINLLRDVQAIMDSFEEDQQSGCACMDRKRMLMGALQRRGYNAAICKTRWDHSNGVSAGDYEFIDVVVALDSSAEPLRLLVDLEFQAQFEIARPLSEFSAILLLVPSIFVGRAERLQQIVGVMAEATKQSLRIKGMHLPPWRKLDYMLAKWFSAYKRTANSLASRSSSHKRSDDDRDISGVTIRGVHNPDMECLNELEILCQDSSKPLQEDSGNASLRSNIRDNLITVTTTSWQPPPIEARSHSNTRMQSGAIGLTSMLLHADIPIRNDAIANAA